MTQPILVNLFGKDKEKLLAESQVIIEARGQVEAEMQAELTVQERARISAHAKLLAQSRASTERELEAQLKAQCQEESKLAEVVQNNLQVSASAKREIEQKLAVELSLQAETQAKLAAEQQAQVELNNRLEQEKKSREAAEALSKVEREVADLLEVEWRTKLDEKSIAERKLKSVQNEVAELVASTERVSAELNAAEQMQISYAGKKLKLETQLLELSLFKEGSKKNSSRAPNTKKTDEIAETVKPTEESQVVETAPSGLEVRSETKLLSEGEAMLVAFHEAELAALAKVAEERAAEKSFVQRKRYDDQIKMDAVVKEQSERLAIESVRQLEEDAKNLARVEAERKRNAEKKAVELLMSQVEADINSARLQDQTNAMLQQAVEIAHERLEKEAQANQLAESKLAVEIELAELEAQRLTSITTEMLEIERKFESEEKQLALIQEQIKLEEQLRLAIERNIEIEAECNTHIRARLSAELKAIESGSERMAIEKQSTEIATKSDEINQQSIQMGIEFAKAAEHALHLSQCRIDLEVHALRAEQDRCHAEKLTIAILQKRIDTSISARKLALSRAEGMEKLLDDEEQKSIQRADQMSAQHEQFEKMLLQLEQQRLEQEKKLAEKFSQHSVATPTTPIKPVPVKPDFVADKEAKSASVEAEHEATQRVNALIEILMRPKAAFENKAKASLDQLSPDEFHVDQVVRTNLEAEHRLLNECWKNTGRSRTRSKSRTIN
jgi:hypothetical protein